MQALQLCGPERLELRELPLPQPAADEVLIQTRAATICTSDLHDIQYNPFGIPYPRTLGHEGAGVVVQAGPLVKGLSPGDRVAAHPVVPCGKCAECLRGYRHICADMGHLGVDRDGCFAAYFVQRADRVRALPAHISFALGALLEPVAVCLQAIARAGDIKGRRVLIAGDGPFGNIIARLALRAGAEQVWVAGREPFRLNRIPGVERVQEAPARSADVAILAVSAPEAVQTCIQALRPRGRLVVFSALREPVAINLFALHVSELEIVGACNDEDRTDEALQCLSDPALALEELITHHIPFENWEEAFALARNGHNKTLKVAIEFYEDNKR